MKKAIVALSFCSCLLPALALADEADDFTDKLLKAVPSQCYGEASIISGNHVRSIVPDMLLEGVRQGAKLDKAWGPGNESYRQARDLVEMTLQDEELSNGPLVDFGLQKLVRTAVGTWSPAERTEYLAFVKQKGGRLYWDAIMDGALCSALIESVTLRLPFLLPEGDEKKRLAALKAGADLRIMSIDVQANLLPKDQRAKINKLGPGFIKSFQDAFSAANLGYGARAGKALEPVAPQVMKFAASYKQ